MTASRQRDGAPWDAARQYLQRTHGGFDDPRGAEEAAKLEALELLRDAGFRLQAPAHPNEPQGD